MALAINASTPPLVTQNAAFITSLPSAVFLPPANSLLVPLIGFPSAANTGTSVTDGLGTPLTYRKLVAHAAGATDMEIWAADAGSTAPLLTLGTTSSSLSTGAPVTSLPVSALSAVIPAGTILLDDGSGHTQTFVTTGAAAAATSVPVSSQTPNFAYPSGSSIKGFFFTANFDNCKSQAIGCAVYTGAQNALAQFNNATVSPANATQGDPSSPPSVTVPSTSAGSDVIAGFGDFASGNTPTPGSGQSISFNGNSYFFSDGGSGGDGCWFQRLTTPSAGGSVTLNCTAPTNATHVAAAEILSASGGGAVVLPPRTPTNWAAVQRSLR